VTYGIVESDDGYVCVTCGKTFNFKSNADRHFRLQHLPVTEAKCHVCSKVFKNAVNRNKHRIKAHGITEKMMRICQKKSLHSATAPCHICHKTFQHRGQRNAHLLKTHGITAGDDLEESKTKEHDETELDHDYDFESNP